MPRMGGDNQLDTNAPRRAEGANGRNLLTITKYSGFDPEVGLSSGSAASAYVNAVDAFNFPGTRNFTLSLSSSF